MQGSNFSPLEAKNLVGDAMRLSVTTTDRAVALPRHLILGSADAVFVIGPAVRNLDIGDGERLVGIDAVLLCGGQADDDPG